MRQYAHVHRTRAVNYKGMTCTLSNYKYEVFIVLLVLKTGWWYNMSRSRIYDGFDYYYQSLTLSLLVSLTLS